MKMRGWTGVLVLLCAGGAQAVNTAVTLHGRSWGQSQQGLVGYVERFDGNAAGGADPNIGSSGSNEGLLYPMLGNEVNLPALSGRDPTALSPLADDAAGARPMNGLIGGGDAGDWANDPHWSLVLKNGDNKDFLDASSRVQLPAYADIDWVPTPLPTVRKTSIMEVVVFPSLGLLVLILLVTWLVLRVRRHRPLKREQQLLQV